MKGYDRKFGWGKKIRFRYIKFEMIVRHSSWELKECDMWVWTSTDISYWDVKARCCLVFLGRPFPLFPSLTFLFLSYFHLFIFLLCALRYFFPLMFHTLSRIILSSFAVIKFKIISVIQGKNMIYTQTLHVNVLKWSSSYCVKSSSPHPSRSSVSEWPVLSPLFSVHSVYWSPEKGFYPVCC